MFYELGQIFGLFMFILFATKWPYELTFKWKYVKKFLIIIFLASIFRTAVFFFIPKLTPSGIAMLSKMPLSFFFSVWWEDAAFILPVVLIYRYFQPKWITWMALGISTFLFASGHQYQGGFSIFMTALYFPVLFYYRKTLGIGTIMVCHILQDVSIILNFKILDFLLGMG